MSVMTEWGYTLPDVDTIPDILTTDEFNTMTGGKFAGDARIPAAIKAACGAVRNYCGWHVSPALSCVVSSAALYGNGSLKRVGADVLLQLPARLVSGVTSVTIDGDAHTDYRIEPNGLIYLFDAPALTRKSEIEITYTAGTASEVVKDLVANNVTHSLASSYGVTSESAGGMSITYNGGWVNADKASALTDVTKEALTSYRLQGVF